MSGPVDFDDYVISNVAAFAMVDDGSAQSPFEAANDTITVPGNETCFFDGFMSVSGHGATAVSQSFSIVGTAVISSINGFTLAHGVSLASSASTAQTTKIFQSAVSTVVLGAGANAVIMLSVKGMMRITTGGTIIPKITQSGTGSGGTIVCDAGSYFRLVRMGTNTQGGSGSVS